MEAGRIDKKCKKTVGSGLIRATDLCYIALFTALICVCGMLSVSVGGVKYSLQLLGVLLTAGVLGVKRGLLATFAYLILGALGVPVFAGFTGGLFTSPTGGYLLGFLFAALVVGLGYKVEYQSENAVKKYAVNFVIRLAFMLLGVALCYVAGTAWFMLFLSGKGGGEGVTLTVAITTCVLPYLLVDFVKILLAILIIPKIRGILR